MHRLSPLDTLFLRLERRHAPFHVGALSLFRPPESAPRDFGAQLVRRLNQSSRVAAPFDRRLVTRLGMDYWVRDENFDLAHHFVHLALPKPGRVDQLPAMVSHVHGLPLDRSRPLWRTYLIEGLEDGRIATYSKIHHAVVDGVAGIRLMLKAMSPDPQVSMTMPPPWQLMSSQAQVPALVPEVTGGVRGFAAQGLNLAPAVFQQLKQSFRDFRASNPDFVSAFQAPTALFNQPISAERRFAVRSYSTARIKAIAAGLGGTCNDVVLALCAAALRRYLIQRRALPPRPLIAAVPVSLRPEGSTTAGNEIAGALVNLGTDIADPLQRFGTIKRSMDYNKTRFRQMTPAQRLAYSAAMLAPGLLTLLPGVQRRIANIVISHVPGPRQPLYWQGCRLEGIYPASLLLDGFGLNITLISRHDTLDFGLLACPQAVPQMPRLLDFLDAALTELEYLALTQAAPFCPGPPDVLRCA